MVLLILFVRVDDIQQQALRFRNGQDGGGSRVGLITEFQPVISMIIGFCVGFCSRVRALHTLWVYNVPNDDMLGQNLFAYVSRYFLSFAWILCPKLSLV